MNPTWDILIPTIPHRHEQLCGLLALLDSQIQGSVIPVISSSYYPVQVLLYRDNLEASYGAKMQALLEASRADYVCCIDDDDLVAAGYISGIREALRTRPDYVGFRVRYTVDGVVRIPVVHSLACDGWNRIDDEPEVLERDIVQFNPMRRELALLGTWEGGWQADFRWANQVRDTRRVRTEVFVEAELYWKRDLGGKDFRQGHQPWDGPMPELPSYPWLVTLEEDGPRRAQPQPARQHRPPGRWPGRHLPGRHAPGRRPG